MTIWYQRDTLVLIRNLSPESILEPKKGTNIRLTEGSREGLRRASFLTNKSMSQIMEEALAEYLERHNLVASYQLNITDDRVVFQKLETPNRIIEVSDRDGRDPENIQLEYQARFQEPIRIVVQDEEDS